MLLFSIKSWNPLKSITVLTKILSSTAVHSLFSKHFDNGSATDITHFTFKISAWKGSSFIPAGKSLLDRPINYSVLSISHSPLVFQNKLLTTSLSLSHSLFPCLSQPPIKAQEMMSSLQSPYDRQKESRGKSERARAKQPTTLRVKEGWKIRR